MYTFSQKNSFPTNSKQIKIDQLKNRTHTATQTTSTGFGQRHHRYQAIKNI